MEQTLGKRIASHRKRLGLTQDALAEQLGITAQAVSRWENDLSCPDITMLPRLAEIFGITTDELLGHHSSEKVHDGEIVDDDGVRVQKGNWEFHWDGGRKNGLFMAFFVLWVGGFTLASRILQWDVSFWSILWPSALIFTGLPFYRKGFSVFHLACLVFGGYFLVSNLGFWSFDLRGELIFPICVVVFGVGLLIDALKKPKKPKFHIHKHGQTEKAKVECKDEANSFSCNLSFGEVTHVVNSTYLEGGNTQVSFGELKVDLSQVEEVASGCEIDANCAFGETIFLVPRQFRVELPERSTAFGHVELQGHPDSEVVGIITLNAHVSFGEITIRYI